jgi:hypothetical protein
MGREIRKSNRGDEFDESILFALMEIPQWNPFVIGEQKGTTGPV